MSILLKIKQFLAAPTNAGTARRVVNLSWLPFLAVVLLLSWLWPPDAHFIKDHHADNMPFGYGTLIHNMRTSGQFVDCHPPGSLFRQPICFHTSRLPMIPLFISVLCQVSTHTVFLTCAKNLVFFGIAWLGFWLVAREWPLRFGWWLLALSFYLLFPHFWELTGSLQAEECYLPHLWVAIFGLTLAGRRTWHFALGGLLIFALYLTKSSGAPLSFAVALFAAIHWSGWGKGTKLTPLPALWPIGALTLAIVAWGGFSKVATGRFAFGANLSSWNGWALYKGNCEYTASLYPDIQLDYLDYRRLILPTVPVKTEWELNDHYRERALTWMKANPGEVWRNFQKKAYAVFLSVKMEGTLPNARGQFITPISPLRIVQRLIFWAAMGLALWRVGQLLLARKWSAALLDPALVFLGTIGGYILPLLVGFCYPRHVVPMVIISVFYLLLWSRKQSPAESEPAK